ncbi:uncharacterized protein LOC122553107 isoform X2 [Chiloscyllium plagiosum]|uniref:uncharacterized protein LOC122553107 isoform X2 n=1 Tax=Chiloscyllium plagiosum TaxID=36176 RepID=UPI001CB81B0E|nr:uncharacterized protein LOC122553107 isoform X2 [Chiloscyllium plagiosum]
MQSKQQFQNTSFRNMTGVYLGMAGSPASFSHIAAVPPLFRRRCLSRAKTSVELRRNKRIEMLRIMDCQPGFKGALVKPKVKIVCPEMKPHPHTHDKSPPLTAEELRNLTRKVLRNFGVPGQSTRDMLERSKRRSCFLSSPKTPPNSTRQSNNPELSVAVNAGRNADPFRATLARQELISTRAGHQEIFENAVRFQPERSNHISQPRRAGTQHLPLKYLQSSQAFTRTEQLDRDGKAHSQSSSRERWILQSGSVGGSAVLHPRKSIPLGRSYLAGKCDSSHLLHFKSVSGYTERGFPEYLTPRLNLTLGHNLISKTLELKQRTDSSDSTKQVPITTPSTDSRVANGSSRMDTLKSKAIPSTKVRSPFNSRTKMSFHSKINTQGTGTGKHRMTDTCEDKIQGSVEEENSKDLVAEPSDLKEAEDSQTSNLNDDEDDEETLEMDSTTHLAKQIEVIIHLKPKVDSSAECSSEKDPEQIDSNEASI